MRWRSRHDEAAFVALVAEQSASLLRTAYLLCYDLSEAEDLVQETWTRLARRWSRVGALDNPAGYARRVLVNAAIDSQPGRSRRRSELTSTASPAPSELVDADGQRALRAVEDQDQLARALAGLSRRQRAVLVLRYFDDLPEKRVAELLGCSTGNVKSTASRALATVRAGIVSASATDLGLPLPAGDSGARSLSASTTTKASTR